MKRISFICLLILLCSLPGQAQFWISFGWNEPHCQSCLWMEQAMRLNGRQAADYHNIVHKYGQRIEKEARKHYRYWDQSAKKIFNLRMERDRKLQRVLSPSQFRLYVRFVRERPQRIHDYQEQLDKMHAQGLDPEDFKYYLEAHKYGLPPHGGLGIGLERLVMKLLGLSNVRQASMFPRDINRLLP